MEPRHETSAAGDGDPSVARVVMQPDEGLVTVLLDDGSEFEVAPDAPELDGVVSGTRLDAELRRLLERAAERKRIARRVFTMLDRRPYARGRLGQKLEERGHPRGLVDAVLDRFVEQGLIDDAAFARAFVEDQLRQRAIGPLSLLQRLRQQGVGSADAEAAVAALVDHERETELARRAARRRASDPPDKLRRFLRSRGFRARAIAAVCSADDFDVD